MQPEVLETHQVLSKKQHSIGLRSSPKSTQTKVMLDRPRYSKNEACGQEVSPEKDSTPRGPGRLAKGKRWNAENSQSDGIAANHSRMLNLR
jgi:hypothetical protein